MREGKEVVVCTYPESRRPLSSLSFNHSDHVSRMGTDDMKRGTGDITYRK